MNSRFQGHAGVGAAIAYFAALGCPVFVPVSEVQRYDLVVEYGGRLVRVECKTSSELKSSGAYRVTLFTSGGNQTWNGIKKHFSEYDADYLFVHVANGMEYLIPSVDVCGHGTITVGNKWQEYLVS